MREHFIVQRLDGYTDGKPSWRKVHVPYTLSFSREAVEGEVERMKAREPKATFRIRKAPKP